MPNRATAAILLAGVLAATPDAPVTAQHTVALAPASSPAVSGVAGPGAARAGRTIALGETKTGTLTGKDPNLDEGEHYHSYSFDGQAGERIIVSLQSSSFDSWLVIFVTDSDWEEQDDDSGGGSNAQLDVTLPQTGRYVILVTSFEGGETGPYTLSVKPHAGSSVKSNDEWIPYGQTSDTDAELSYLPGSVRSQGEDVFEVWTRWVYPAMQPPSTGDEQYDSEKRMVRVDCGSERLGLVAFVEYAGETAVNSWAGRDIDMIPAVPGSVGESLLRRVCKDGR
jgi:hypothetical protein